MKLPWTIFKFTCIIIIFSPDVAVVYHEDQSGSLPCKEIPGLMRAMYMNIRCLVRLQGDGRLCKVVGRCCKADKARHNTTGHIRYLRIC
ncbi:hypothetical protein C8J57DRAFT_1366249 [Mycena rebaudengoi]|nr:hypothetical protein C8J57DRAFT_1366249 [Mycena rebaudengoi]